MLADSFSLNQVGYLVGVKVLYKKLHEVSEIVWKLFDGLSYANAIDQRLILD